MKKEPTQRQLRVATEIHRLVANMLIQGEVVIKNLKPEFLMITQVQVSPDLTHASLFVRAINDVRTNTQVNLLNEHKGLFRHKIGKNIRLRVVPDIIFKRDDTMDIVDSVEQLLNNPKVRQDLNNLPSEQD